MQNSIIVSENDTKNLTEIQIFENSEFGKVRTVVINNEPYFVGKDVCELFGDSHYRRSLLNIDEDERTIHKIKTAGGMQDMIIINESGLYSLLFSMQPQKAKGVTQNEQAINERIEKLKKFKHWVTSVVLPSIRKNGGYINNQENISESELMAKAVLVAQKVMAEKDKKIALMQPKADVYDQLVDRSKCINFRDMAEKLGMKQSEFMTILKAKYIYKNSVGEYRAYADYQDLFSLRTFNKSTEKTGEQLMLNMKGITYFCNKYKPGAVADSWIKKHLEQISL